MSSWCQHSLLLFLLSSLHIAHTLLSVVCRTVFCSVCLLWLQWNQSLARVLTSHGNMIIWNGRLLRGLWNKCAIYQCHVSSSEADAAVGD